MIFSFLRKQAANILTFINMILGLASILFAIQNNFKISGMLIIIAAVTDFMDGWVARKLNITSALGKFLDSNSDLISFGVAPGILLYLSVLNQFGAIGILVSGIFILCGAFRLARFNAIEFSGYYVGIPITIAGAIVALTLFAIPLISGITYLIIPLILSYLMVSNHAVKKV